MWEFGPLTTLWAPTAWYISSPQFVLNAVPISFSLNWPLNNNLRRVTITNFVINFFRDCCYLLCHRPKYRHKHLALRLPRFILLPQGERHQANYSFIYIYRELRGTKHSRNLASYNLFYERNFDLSLSFPNARTWPFPGVKRPGHECDHSAPTSDEI
jgi:hypothetical protein